MFSTFGFAEKPVYKGVYGDWSIEPEDVREVVAYRAGLNVAALGVLAAAAHLFRGLLHAIFSRLCVALQL